MTVCATTATELVIINYSMDDYFVLNGDVYLQNTPYGVDTTVCSDVEPNYNLSDPIDVTPVMLWQYNNADKLQAIIEKKQAWIEANHNQFWSDWTRDVFTLATANDFGCSVWAIILGVSFTADVSDGTKLIFGFGPYQSNFYASNFSAVAGGDTVLTTEQKRLVLQLRYLYMISRSTVTEINRSLELLFGDAYIVDNYDMTMTITFVTAASSDAMYILQNYDVIPVPAGVALIY